MHLSCPLDYRQDQDSVTGHVLYDTQLFFDYHRRTGGILN